jgi:hypothetical protein
MTDADRQQSTRDGDILIGSERHRALFCGLLLDTFDPYRPAIVEWPQSSVNARARLAGLPFWDVALETEENAGTRMQELADVTSDPLIREALALNACSIVRRSRPPVLI